MHKYTCEQGKEVLAYKHKKEFNIPRYNKYSIHTANCIDAYLNFPSLDADYLRATSWKKVKKDMQMWHLPIDFWTAIENGLQHLIQGAPEPNSPPLPFLMMFI
jgi:hypothetical protein